MMRNEVQSSNQVSDVAIDSGPEEGMLSSDLLVNSLVYRSPASLSLASERTYIRHFPQNVTSSAGQTTVFDFTSGTSFGNPDNSYLTFNVASAGGTAGSLANFGCGSAMNLIRQVTIRSRSGTELSRVEYANVWSRYYHINTLSQEYLDHQGLMEGWNVGQVSDANGTVFDPSVAGATAGYNGSKFNLPLSRLSPFFHSVKKNLKYPPQLLAGLHMEIIWEDAAVALLQTAGQTITGYNLSNIAIMIDSMTMTDDTQRAINLEAAQNGLEVTVPAVYTTQYSSPSGQTNINIQVRKAVTQANFGMLVILNQATRNTITSDSFLSYGGDATSFQYRLGSLYFPKQALVGYDASGSSGAGVNRYGQNEMYLSTLMTFDKLRNPVSEGAVSLINYNARDYTLCCSLEKDAALQVSGLPVNNSRTLETLLTLQNNDRARLCFLFLDYTSVIRTFMDNASLSV